MKTPTARCALLHAVHLPIGPCSARRKPSPHAAADVTATILTPNTAWPGRLRERRPLVHADAGQHARRRAERTGHLPERVASIGRILPVAGAAPLIITY